MQLFSRDDDWTLPWLVLVCVAVACLTLPVAAEPPVVTTAETAAAPSAETVQRWYRVEVDGQRAGWMLVGETRQARRWVHDRLSVLELRRGDLRQKVEMASRFTETLDGRPVSAASRQVLGAVPIETDYRYSESGIDVEIRHGDETQRQQLPLPEGDWLTPGQAQREIERRLAENAETFELRTVDPQFGTQPFEVLWQRQPGDEASGVTHWRQSQSVAPQLATLLQLDAMGHMVHSSVHMMGVEMTMTRTSKQDALAAVAAPEILLKTFLRPSQAIKRPRQVRRGTYDLKFEGGVEAFLDSLPSLNTGRQTVTREGDRLRVTVDMTVEAPETSQSAAELAPYLAPSTYLNHEDPVLQGLHKRALRGVKPDPARRAETLRRFVARHLSDKNLSSVMATASEAAVQRSGDCTEHSVLLAALLRRDGIPSRVAAGLVYVDRFVGETDFFGYHMWTQALLDGRWVDLDASLGKEPFDATHIQLATSALDDDKMALMELAHVAPWIGRADIEVIDVAYGNAGR